MAAVLSRGGGEVTVIMNASVNKVGEVEKPSLSLLSMGSRYHNNNALCC